MPMEKSLASPRILVVEDDLTQRVLWKQILHLAVENAEVHWADSYEAAAQLFKWSAMQHQEFDLMISDVFLNGEETGFELFKDYFHQVRGHAILVSNFGTVETLEPLTMQAGNEPIYLRKPLDPVQVIATVKKLLYGREKR